MIDRKFFFLNGGFLENATEDIQFLHVETLEGRMESQSIQELLIKYSFKVFQRKNFMKQ